MIQKKKDRLTLGIAFVLSLLGGLIVYYLKTDEITELKREIKQLKRDKQNLETKLNQYSGVISQF
tara:strand:- start:2890 stop:3084 length:195 start_codon:yes stop_codon:yes gene_type:complete